MGVREDPPRYYLGIGDSMARTLPIDPRLEDNYNNMARRPDAPELIQQWAERSAVYRRNADASLDCAYGPGDRERIDIFRCGDRQAPLLVYLHGGYWQRGDKSIYSFIAPVFNTAGVDVAVIGYPLCPQVSLAEIVTGIRNALVWLYRNASSLAICADRINLCGHSAGGHLTAMALTTSWPDHDADLPADLVKTGIPLSGLYLLEPLLHTTIADALHLTTDEVRQLSPCYSEPTTDAPVLAIVGGDESDEFFRQTDELIGKWSRPGLQTGKFVEPDVDHFDLVERLATADSEIYQRVMAWLR